MSNEQGVSPMQLALNGNPWLLLWWAVTCRGDGDLQVFWGGVLPPCVDFQPCANQIKALWKHWFYQRNYYNVDPLCQCNAVYLVAMCRELLPSSSMAPASAPASTSSITWVMYDVKYNTNTSILGYCWKYFGGYHWEKSTLDCPEQSRVTFSCFNLVVICLNHVFTS